MASSYNKRKEETTMGLIVGCLFIGIGVTFIVDFFRK